MAKFTKKQIAAAMAKLPEIVKATQSESFVYTDSATHGPLIEAGLVEINETITNEAGAIATRATEKALTDMSKTDAATDTGAAAADAAAAATAGGYELATCPLPSISGRGRGAATVYPFDKMEVGQSFFVPNSAERTNAAKSMASTVSSATARYAVETGETKANKAGEQVPVMKETRKFVVRSRTAEAEAADGFKHGQAGARVYRIA